MHESRTTMQNILLFDEALLKEDLIWCMQLLHTGEYIK